MTEDYKYKIECRCGFAYKNTPKCADRESAKTVWNDIANAEINEGKINDL